MIQGKRGKGKKEGTRTPHHHDGTTFFLAILSNGPWGIFVCLGILEFELWISAEK
jgi:hypothetical protein